MTFVGIGKTNGIYIVTWKVRVIVMDWVRVRVRVKQWDIVLRKTICGVSKTLFNHIDA